MEKTNPIDLLGVHPTGAIPSKYDPRRFKWEEVAFGAAPFDWNKGYDVEADLSAALKQNTKLPIKDQGQSGSCGGQATANYGDALTAFTDGKQIERSAKFIYAPVAAPGGGSSGPDLDDIVTLQGFAPESLTPSYHNGQPPSEAFMDRTQDITDAARVAALSDRAMSPVDVNASYIDSIAQAIEANKGIRLAIVGSNNGTWLSANPQPPKNGDDFWYHFLYAGKARLFNKNGVIVKQIGVFNSWGATVGEEGWQWLDEAYFKTTLSGAALPRAVWEATTYVMNPNPIRQMFKHTFSHDLAYGQSSLEVKSLQIGLQALGFFPASVPTSQLYGNITRQAVLAFQLKYHVAPEATLDGLMGKSVGPATRNELNVLFG